jgi:PAS domain S-box-containing protein
MKNKDFLVENKVLVVDDDQVTRVILCQILEKEGYQVFEAGDGTQALALFKRLKPAVVIIDAMLPVMDGFTVCARLCELSGGRIPVLMLTSLNDEESVKLALQAGAADFSTKPVNGPVLCRRVERLLRSRKIEFLLKKSRASKQSLIINVPDGIIGVNKYGLIESFNPAAERVFGYSYAEAVGQSVRKMLPDAFREQEQVFIEHPGIENKMFNSEREGTGWRKDGSNFPVAIKISGFCAGDRLVIVRDITERKLAEDNLRLTARVFESVSEGIIVVDSAGNIQTVNAAAVSITGYRKEELVGRHYSFLKVILNDSSSAENILSGVRKNHYWQGRVWSRRKDGGVYPVWLSISAVRNETIRNTYAVIFRDITEQVRWEAEKQKLAEQAARVQRINSMGNASASIAHEINQPLNSIKVIADSVLYWYKKGQVNEVAPLIESFQKITDQAGRISSIIKNIRNFVSAGSAGRQEPCNLNNSVSRALAILDHRFREHGIKIKKSLTWNLPPVLGNQSMFEEIILNLLANAVQALDVSSRDDKIINCVTRQEEEKILLEITDNGTGLDNGMIDKIFDPFFTTKTAGKGMGLGLAIVHSGVSVCNGKITAENNHQGGATFKLEFPVANESAWKK